MTDNPIAAAADTPISIKPINEDFNGRMNDIVIEHLLESAQGAIFGAIELHNKPIFPARYEVSIVLTINAWEALLKSYIAKFHPEKKIFEDDKTTLAFDKCVSFVASKLGTEFTLIQESLTQLYQYRCDIIHCYGEGIELILYSLLRPNIISFAEFLNKHFHIDLGKKSNLIILPIGFNKTITPTDFLSKKSIEGNEYVKGFISRLIKSMEKLSEQGIEDGLLCNYGMFLEKENNPKHADLIISFTKDPKEAQLTLNKVTTIGGYTNDKKAPKVQIEESNLLKIFYMPHKDFTQKVRESIVGFKANDVYLKVLAKIKADPNCFWLRVLDPSNPKSVKQGFYSDEALKKAIEEFTGQS